MGFVKKFIREEDSILALKNGNLKEFYSSSDALFFEDKTSIKIFELFKKGKNETYIINKLKIKF
jgi:hypothetical protein